MAGKTIRNAPSQYCPEGTQNTLEAEGRETAMTYSLARRFYDREGVLWSDLLAVDQTQALKRRSLYDDDQNPIDSTEHDRRMKLFWHVWMPEAVERSWVGQMPNAAEVPHAEGPVLGRETALPASIEDEYLERLRYLESAQRWVYDDANQELNKSEEYDTFSEGILLEYQHIAAACAFALQRRDGYSDDVRDCLHRAWWACNQVEHPRSLAHPWLKEAAGKYQVHDFSAWFSLEERFWSEWSQPHYYLSSLLVSALVLLEQARLSRGDLKFEEAFNLYVNAAERINSAVPMLDERFESSRWQMADSDVGPAEVIDSQAAEWRKMLRGRLGEFRLDTTEFTSVVEQLLLPGHEGTKTHVAEVAKKCGHMADILLDDFHFDGRVWNTDWYQAATAWRQLQGRAQERMSPSELRQLREEEALSASEKRLKDYFFSDELWSELGRRAQLHLVNAERTWVAPGRGAVESTLSELQMAVESVCHRLFWDSQDRSQQDKLRAELSIRGQTPNLGDFAKLLELPMFKTFLAFHRLEKEKDFLVRELPETLRSLQHKRNVATHEVRGHWSREMVTPFMNRYLGIGQEGVLPRLAAIGRKLGASPKSGDQRT